MYGHGDESLPGVWVQNPYYQYFSGMDRFQWRFPVAPSDLLHFRGRLGPCGMEKIFGWSVALHGKKAHEKILCVDTTAGGNQYHVSHRRQALRESDGAAAGDCKSC
ncbi:hypothetical protein [Aliifodinibius sp. S!AR15-10]|uniref:hypothetical protein n=1 Tax=Aliifodinibius sp. S!AR15-10 TaxID=2950437 RepID=UPI0038F719E1